MEAGDTTESKKKHARSGATKLNCIPLQASKFRLTIRKGSKNKYRSNNSSAPAAAAAVPALSHQGGISTDYDAYYHSVIEKLQSPQKDCLFSFAVFPKDAVVKKRLLVYWWMGEGLLDLANPTKSATEILTKFEEEKLIVPVYAKRKKATNRFKMDPLVRSKVIEESKKANFFSYDSEGKLTWKNSESKRACLMEAGKLESELVQDKNKITTLFNVNRWILDLPFDWFPKMRDVEVLCLGMWCSSGEHHHIEVKNTEFLKGLKYLKSLRLLSFHGISGIQGLPGSISKLRKLRILDLKACYNLESLPRKIKSLKMLTHLDLSECYLLDHIPKELGSLSKLQVLKGFVITGASHGNHCTHPDLAGLKKLRKLSINVNSGTFSIEELSTSVLKLEELEKLKIAWGGGSKANESTGKPKSKDDKEDQEIKEEAKKLEKVDLQCYPHEKLPGWLNPKILTKLNKLYIRGGGLKSLEKGEIKWEVKTLQLKYLSQLKTNWRDLNAIFPELDYLEKFKCPKVTFCPCDGSGVWKKPCNCG